MALTTVQKARLKEALWSGWFNNRPGDTSFHPTIEDTARVAAMADEDVIPTIEAYVAAEIVKLNARILKIQDRITDESQLILDIQAEIQALEAE